MFVTHKHFMLLRRPEKKHKESKIKQNRWRQEWATCTVRYNWRRFTERSHTWNVYVLYVCGIGSLPSFRPMRVNGGRRKKITTNYNANPIQWRLYLYFILSALLDLFSGALFIHIFAHSFALCSWNGSLSQQTKYTMKREIIERFLCIISMI